MSDEYTREWLVDAEGWNAPPSSGTAWQGIRLPHDQDKYWCVQVFVKVGGPNKGCNMSEGWTCSLYDGINSPLTFDLTNSAASDIYIQYIFSALQPVGGHETYTPTAY